MPNQRSSRQRPPSAFALLVLLLVLASLASCGPSPSDLEWVDYTPLPGGDWEVSTPEEQGLDPDLLAALYLDAVEVDTIRSLLVVKNGGLIADGYFHDGSIDQKARLQSATKSFTSALVGLALEEGCLSSVDQKAVEFFPELVSQIDDPRKKEITIRHLLQMRLASPGRNPPRRCST